MLVRPDALRVIAAKRTNEIFVSFFTTAFEWMAISPSDLNYTFIGAMGQIPSHALGLALAFPERRVIALDGDGGLLMNLGCLVTTAKVAPRNLVHVLLNNNRYEMTGGQPTPGSDMADYAALARAAGFPLVYQFDEMAPLERAVPEILSTDGPIFVELKVVPGAPIVEDWANVHSQARQDAFRRVVQAKVAGAR